MAPQKKEKVKTIKHAVQIKLTDVHTVAKILEEILKNILEIQISIFDFSESFWNFFNIF